MIAVVGEALIDLVIEPDGRVTATPGGAPFNTARACGRLGADVMFVGGLSTDRFGSILRDRLIEDGVAVGRSPVVDRPTTLAAAELDGSGSAAYRFYTEGTSALLAGPIDLADVGVLAENDGPPTAVDVVFTGGLALALEPLASAVEAMLAVLDRSAFVVVDVNCRPFAIADRDAYVSRIDRVLQTAHVVKVSEEDLEYLAPGSPPLVAARGLVRRDRPSAVLVTGGGGDVHVVVHDGEVAVPIAMVDLDDMVDTIGAGDTFSAGFLTWWTAHGFGVDEAGDLSLLVRAVRAASVAAGVACTRRGADPPWRSDLPDDWAS